MIENVTEGIYPSVLSKFCETEDCLHLFNMFPTGLIIIKPDENAIKEDLNIVFVNDYAKRVLITPQENKLRCNLEKFKKLNLLEINSEPDSDYNLLKFIQDETDRRSSCLEEKFIFEEVMIYVKIKKLFEYKLISIENFSDERKLMERNLFRNIRSQYLVTMSHELNNPMNSLINSIDEIIIENDYDYMNTEKIESLKNTIESSMTLMKFFIRNFLISLKVITEGSGVIKRSTTSVSNTENSVNLHFLLSKMKKKFRNLYSNKNILMTHNLKLLKHIIVKYDYCYFKWLIKNIFIYFYHNVDTMEVVKINAEFTHDNELEIIFEQHSNEKYPKSPRSAFNKSFLNHLDIESSLKTTEIYKENILSLASFLKIKVVFFDDIIKICTKYTRENLSENDDLGEETSPRMSKQLNFYKLKRGIAKGTTDAQNTRKSPRMGSFIRVNSHKSTKTFPNNKIKDEGISVALENSNFLNFPENPRCKTRNKTVIINDNHKQYLIQEIMKKKKESSSLSLSTVKSDKKNAFLGNQMFSKDNFKENNTNLQNLLGTVDCIFYDNPVSAEISIPIPETYNIFQDVVTTKEIFPSDIIFTSKFKSSSSHSDFCVDPSLEEEDIIIERNNVLIVDDEAFNRKIMKSILNKMNVNTDTCINGLECLEKVQDKEYKMILMDVMMPEMDGIEASQRIQEMVEQGKLKDDISIVIISAHSIDEIIEKVKKIKVVKEFLNKPVNKTKIAELLEKYYII